MQAHQSQPDDPANHRKWHDHQHQTRFSYRPERPEQQRKNQQQGDRHNDGQTTLRSLLILSFATGLIYNAMPPVGPLWLVLFWLTVYVFINVYRIVTKLAEARKVRLTEEEAELRDTVFPEFTPVEFAKLMRISTWKAVPAGVALTTQGKMVSEVSVIQSGHLNVEIDGRNVHTMKDGEIVGEMSFIGGNPATATVRTITPTRYVAWEQPALRAGHRSARRVRVPRSAHRHERRRARLPARAAAVPPWPRFPYPASRRHACRCARLRCGHSRGWDAPRDGAR